MLKFSLTEDEFESLADKYRTSDGLFDHAGFCKTINLAFTQKGIDYEPTATVKPVTKDDTYLARRKYLEITPEEEEAVQSILEEYKRVVKNKRMNLKPQF